MKTLFKIILLVPAVLFVVMGVRWLVDPGGIAPELGLVLDAGAGRSSQVADFSAFFLTAGLCMLLGLVTGRRLWYYPPIMLLLLAAIGRLVAWAVHDAAFTGSMIAFEILVVLLLLATSRWLPDKD